MYTYIICSFRDQIISTNTLLAMTAQITVKNYNRVVSLPINITIYYMHLCK